MVGIHIGIILLLIVLNGLLAMSELAIVSARPTRLQNMAEDGNAGAAAALELAQNPGRFLSTIQIGITLIGVINGAFGGATLSGPMGNLLAHIPFLKSYSRELGGILVVLIITYLSLVVGELVPKQLALQHPEKMASFVAQPMRALATVFKPVVAFLAISNELLLRLMGAKDSDEPVVTEDEIRLMLMQATDAGVFERAEQEMVAGVFGLGDRTAGELMTPRHAIKFLDTAKSSDDNMRIVLDSGYTLYPVIDDDPDNVVGIASLRDLLESALSGEPVVLREHIRPALFVPEILPVLQVLRSMREHKTNMAVVIDEYGGVEGLITGEDVIADLVDELGTGDIATLIEDEEVAPQSDGSWIVEGRYPAHEFRQRFGIDELAGEEAGRFETIAGYVLDQLGHIPHVGESISIDGYQLVVKKMDGYRIDRILVMPLSVPLAERE